MNGKREREYLTSEEIQRLLRSAKEGATRHPERDHCMLTLLYYHGLRVSELCGLRLNDINLAGEPSIFVRHEKGGSPSAQPLHKPDLVALRVWLKIRETMNVTNDHLFVTQQGEGFTRAAINLMITKVGKATGLEHLKIHPHSLRHACGYHLLNSGQDVRVVQDYLGHKSIQTTVRYTKLAPNRFKGLF